MPVPTIADVEGDGPLEIVVSLKDGEDQVRQVEVYTVASSSDNCLLCPPEGRTRFATATWRWRPSPASGAFNWRRW
jgi:hypothetical protein